MNKYFGTVKNCICEGCVYTTECEYFNDTIYPIVSRVCSPNKLNSFTAKIIDVLEDFECENYE